MYFIDSIEYLQADELEIQINSIDEMFMMGKNFKTSPSAGSSNLCGGSTNDLV